MCFRCVFFAVATPPKRFRAKKKCPRLLFLPLLKDSDQDTGSQHCPGLRPQVLKVASQQRWHGLMLDSGQCSKEHSHSLPREALQDGWLVSISIYWTMGSGTFEPWTCLNLSSHTTLSHTIPGCFDDPFPNFTLFDEVSPPSHRL